MPRTKPVKIQVKPKVNLYKIADDTQEIARVYRELLAFSEKNK